MKPSLFFLLCFCLNLTVLGQIPETDKKAKSEVTKLSFLVGDWEGSGWTLGPNGEKYPFTHTESLKFKLDSTAILAEGTGMAEGKLVHDAMGIISFNHQGNKYSFHSFLFTGMSGKFNAELIEDTFYWYPNEEMRFIIALNEKGQWHETGEKKMDGNWIPFLEMTMNKK